MGVCHFGHFLLTALVWPMLSADDLWFWKEGTCVFCLFCKSILLYVSSARHIIYVTVIMFILQYI